MNDDLSALRIRLEQLPPSNTHQFGQDVRAILNSLSQPVPSMRAILQDRTIPPDARFAALYALTVRFWRDKEYMKYVQTVHDYDGEFGSNPLYDVFRAQVELCVGDDTHHLMSALDYSDSARNALPQLPGALHLYAELTASVQERLPEPNRGNLKKAASAARRAISASQGNYAKYFATLARLQLLEHKFDDARSSLQKAIDKEDVTASDYSLRLTEYQLIRQRIEFAEQQSQVRRTEARAMDELREFRGQMLQSMGLLAAVIAFVVATISGASDSPFKERSGEILIQSGSVVVVFAAFGGVFRVGRLWGIVVAVLAGVGVILAGLWVGGYWL